MKRYDHIQTEEPPNPGIRFIIGLILFLLSFFMLPAGIFLQQYISQHFWQVFVLSIFWVSAPVMKLSSVAILGKPTYLWIKYKFWHLFVKVTKPHEVSRTRYTIGLIMFCLPIIPNYIMSFAPQVIAPAYHLRLIVNLCIDAVFISSVFVLGGDFWDKLRALFIYTAKVQFEEKSENERAG
jgi:hypothetical protein